MTETKAHIIFTNGQILTQDLDQPQVGELAIRDDHILAAGDDLSHLRDGQTQVVDLDGAVLTPGFIDAHLHFIWGGQGLLSIPIQNARSREQFMQIVSEYVQDMKPGSWIQGNGWNENILEEKILPNKAWLDEAAPGFPIILIRHDGHSAIVSSEALRIAGINSDTPDPMGGVIDRDNDGQATGILRDSAMNLVSQHIPDDSREDLERHFLAAQQYLLENGVTTVCDMIYDLEHFRLFQELAQAGKLKVRITAYLPLLKWPEIKTLMAEGMYQDEWIQFKGLKGFCDGSLGSHTALMLKPYEDTPDETGIYDSDWEDVNLVRSIIDEADQQGLQVVIHAIGDRANREVLDLFEEISNKNGERDRRFRVEHAQHVHPQDQGRFRDLDVIASMQPAHCLDDSLYAENLLGDRCEYAYPFKSILNSKAQLVLGSDWPVSPADPLLSIHAALHRNNWIMNEAIGFEQALDGHFQSAAHAIFREGELGVLKAGAKADLTVLKPEFLELPTSKNQPHDLIQKVYVNGKETI